MNSKNSTVCQRIRGFLADGKRHAVAEVAIQVGVSYGQAQFWLETLVADGDAVRTRINNIVEYARA